MRRTEGTSEAVRAVTEADTGSVSRQRSPKPPLTAVREGSMEKENLTCIQALAEERRGRTFPTEGIV